MGNTAPVQLPKTDLIAMYKNVLKLYSPHIKIAPSKICTANISGLSLFIRLIFLNAIPSWSEIAKHEE